MKTLITTLFFTFTLSLIAVCQMPDYHVGGIALDKLESTYIIVQFKKAGKVAKSDTNAGIQYYKAIISHGSEQPCLLKKEVEESINAMTDLCDGLRDKNKQLVRVSEPIEILNVLEKSGWEMITPIKRKKRFKKTHHLVFMFQKIDS
ncbi:MAG: hypothetical protein AAFV78_01385 [Bacteroidota bacterium]